MGTASTHGAGRHDAAPRIPGWPVAGVHAPDPHTPRRHTPRPGTVAARRRVKLKLSGPNAEEIAEIAGAVADPELPMISLLNLGVLRAVDVTDGHVTVTITPTYSGCPAMQMMGDDIVTVLNEAGYPDVTVNRVLKDAWSSDDMSKEGRDSLAQNGIAPPVHRASDGVPEQLVVPCPQCDSLDTEQLSRFGATSCKALYRCRACAEPFEYFKVL